MSININDYKWKLEGIKLINNLLINKEKLTYSNWFKETKSDFIIS